MQPTELQVQRSLAALRGADSTRVMEEPGVVCPFPEEATVATDDYPADVFRRVDEVPEIRAERLEEARRRLDAGDQPTADALAQRMVGRFVCDRLR